ncbi:MAG: hypothetical protein JST30_14820 [Armatimonadetes bacterium]|nr:hypothetical protein [Armatimonadota bacterium]
MLQSTAVAAPRLRFPLCTKLFAWYSEAVKALAWEAVFGSGYFGTIDLEGTAGADADGSTGVPPTDASTSVERIRPIEDDVTKERPEAKTS